MRAPEDNNRNFNIENNLNTIENCLGCVNVKPFYAIHINIKRKHKKEKIKICDNSILI